MIPIYPHTMFQSNKDYLIWIENLELHDMMKTSIHTIPYILSSNISIHNHKYVEADLGLTPSAASV